MIRCKRLDQHLLLFAGLLRIFVEILEVETRDPGVAIPVQGLRADIFLHSYAEWHISLAVGIPRGMPPGYFTDSLNISREYISHRAESRHV